MTRDVKPMQAVGILILMLALIAGGAWLAWGGPLSDQEISARLHGIPTGHQAVTCSTGQATASTALPPGSLVRIAVEGTVGINYAFGAAGTTLAVNGGPYLPAGVVEYVQNGAGIYFFCIQRSGSSTPSIAIMQ